MDIKRFIIFILILGAASFLIYYVLYMRNGYGFKVDLASNVFFLVGVLTFLPSLMAHLETFQLFYGFQYAMRSLFSGEFRSKYRSLNDYILFKKSDEKSTVFLEMMIASGLFLIASVVFALLWDRQL